MLRFDKMGWSANSAGSSGKRMAETTCHALFWPSSAKKYFCSLWSRTWSTMLRMRLSSKRFDTVTTKACCFQNKDGPSVAWRDIWNKPDARKATGMYRSSEQKNHVVPFMRYRSVHRTRGHKLWVLMTASLYMICPLPWEKKADAGERGRAAGLKRHKNGLGRSRVDAGSASPCSSGTSAKT